MLLEKLIGEWSFIGVILAAIIEEIAFLLPSSLVQLGAGFLVMGSVPITLASVVKLLFGVALPIAIGTVLGSFVLYGIGYWFGKPFLDRFGKYLGVTWKEIESILEYTKEKKSDEVLLFVARILPVVPNTPIGVACGVIRYPLWKYIGITFFGIFVRAIIIGFIGWQAGATYEQYAVTLESYKWWAFGAVIAGGLLIAWYALKRRKNRV
jgi:membrane protein DedA with SNARE-associated domain